MERETSPNYTNPLEPIEKTLAVITPEGMQFCEEIIQKIAQAGFKVIQSKVLKLTPEQASEFCENKYGTKTYPILVSNLCQGPIRVMCLSKPQAIKEFRALIGMETARESRAIWPGSLRAYYGSYINDIDNAVMGSENPDQARFEINYFFPNLLIEPIQNDKQATYLNTYVYPILMNGIYETCKKKPSEPIQFLANWMLQHNRKKPIINENRKMDEFDTPSNERLTTIREVDEE